MSLDSDCCKVMYGPELWSCYFQLIRISCLNSDRGLASLNSLETGRVRVRDLAEIRLRAMRVKGLIGIDLGWLRVADFL